MADGIDGLQQNGVMGGKAADTVVEINTIDNSTIGLRYDALLAEARAKTGDENILLNDLTDNQVI